MFVFVLEAALFFMFFFCSIFAIQNYRYFLDGDLLDRVPSLMLLVSGIFVAMQIPGIILLREPSEKEVKAIVAMVEEEEKRNKVKEEEEGEEEREDEKAEEGQKRVKKATEGDSESTCSSSSSSSEDTEPEVFSVHPRDVLKTKEFYIVSCLSDMIFTITKNSLCQLAVGLLLRLPVLQRALPELLKVVRAGAEHE